MTIIDEFNQIASLAGVRTIKRKRSIFVEQYDSECPITVWRKTPATIHDVHHKSNEDGFRWTAVYNGIRQTPNYKPF